MSGLSLFILSVVVCLMIWNSLLIPRNHLLSRIAVAPVTATTLLLTPVWYCLHHRMWLRGAHQRKLKLGGILKWCIVRIVIETDVVVKIVAVTIFTRWEYYCCTLQSFSWFRLRGKETLISFIETRLIQRGSPLVFKVSPHWLTENSCLTWLKEGVLGIVVIQIVWYI